MTRTMSPEAADWYSGTVLERSMASVIQVLNEVTGSNWHAEHTGGGCFWLCTYLTPEDWNSHYLVLTDAAGPLSGDQTVAEVEETGGWSFGHMDGSTEDHSVDGDYPYWGPFATEEMPLRAKEIIDRIREEIA